MTLLNALSPQAPDKILSLMTLYRDDPRPGKIDLGVGVYRDAEGRTPVMRAVRAAGRRILETEETKSYTALAGEPAYHRAMAALILGEDWPEARLAALATVGGTGAIRQALELVRLAASDDGRRLNGRGQNGQALSGLGAFGRRPGVGARVWVPEPTWPNHHSILSHLGAEVRPYRYYDAETGGVAFGAMMEDLAAIGAGDVLLLHGCCHNPTGANLTLPEWADVAALIGRAGAVPLVDLAYQGFGDGLAEDAAGTRLLARRLPEVLIAASCSKNFGIYRERTGILLALAPDTATRDLAQMNLTALNRLSYSFAPDHGARLVTTILGDPALRSDWEAELEGIRTGMVELRTLLVAELRQRSGSDRFGFLAQHRGMFSRLGATPEEVALLRRDHAIYMTEDSRINVAGLNAASVPVLAQAMIDCGL